MCSNGELPDLDQSLYKNDPFKYRPKLKLNENGGYREPKRNVVLEYSFERDHDKSFFMSAPPGVGKTTAIAGITRTWELVKGKYHESVVLCFTHAVIDRLAKDDVFARTIDSFFGFKETENYIVPVVKRIIIDEHGMISTGLWRKFIEYKRKNPECIFQIFGDDNQTKGGGREIKMRGSDTDVIVKCLCDGNIRYIKEHDAMRCDKTLFNANQEFIKTGIISKAFENRKSKKSCKTNADYEDERQ